MHLRPKFNVVSSVKFQIGLLLSVFIASTVSSYADVADVSPTKKILVLSCKGGYGHLAAAKTLQSILGDRYDIEVIYPIEELKIWGISSGEQVYNMMLLNGWIRSTNIVTRHVAPHLFESRKNKMEKIIHSHIDRVKPDLLVSVMPFINLPATEAARKSAVPYLMITTDNDLKNWVLGLENVKHPNFKITIGNDLPQTRQMLLSHHIASASIETIGLPLRLDFIENKDREKLKKEYQIPDGKPVILIMMGGAGANNAFSYAKRILNLNFPTHVIVCAGRNLELAQKLKRMKISGSSTLTVMPFTERVADLMALSDLIITKPGPGSINEAIAMKVPMLIDNTSVPLYWERANIELVQSYGVGECIKHIKQTKRLLIEYLTDDDLRETIKDGFARIPENRFHERIESLVEEMCAQKNRMKEPTSELLSLH